MDTPSTCQELGYDALMSRLEDIRKLWKAVQDGDPDRHIDELGTFNDYGLELTMVPSEKGRYIRWVLCTGGPHEEFRLYYTARGSRHSVQQVEFWYHDWTCGVSFTLSGSSKKLLENIFQYWKETGAFWVAVKEGRRLYDDN